MILMPCGSGGHVMTIISFDNPRLLWFQPPLVWFDVGANVKSLKWGLESEESRITPLTLSVEMWLHLFELMLHPCWDMTPLDMYFDRN